MQSTKTVFAAIMLLSQFQRVLLRGSQAPFGEMFAHRRFKC